jgi:branched-chain amino acid transport system substrate-binding protein
MLKAIQHVAEQVNAAGGLLGRKVEIVSEDTQTNPDAAVRAARKLIDVDKVAAVMGTWASAVTTAVAPLCWESKTFLTTVSGSDTITLLPHNGYLVRTQPNTHLQIGKLGEYIIETGSKRVYVMGAQTPFAVPSQDRLKEVLPKGGVQFVGALIYDRDKTSFRSEVDQALKADPDMIYLNGYTPDVTVLLRDLFRAGYTKNKVSQAYAINQKLVSSLPAEVVEGAYVISPSPSLDSRAYRRLTEVLGSNDLDPYSCQTHDHASLVMLSIAKAKEASGTAIRDTVRKISQGAGEKVDSAVDGLRLLGQGKEINFEGASGPCDFDAKGDIADCKFRYERVEKGQFRLLRVA